MAKELLQFPSPELERASQIYAFDSVTIGLHSNPMTVAFCSNYFDTYAQIGGVSSRQYDWGVVDNVDSRTPNSWVADEGNRSIALSSQREDGRFAMRALRSIVMLEDIVHGKHIMKGGTIINKRGNGLVLMGEKFAGKTSLILSYMLKDNDPRAKYITNSQVSLGMEGDSGLFAFGYAMSMGVRLEVLELMRQAGNEQVEPLINDLIQNMQPGEEGRYYLEPDVLRKYFDNRIEAKTQVGSIVVVKSIPPGTRPSMRRMSPEEAKQFMAAYKQRHFNLEGSWYKFFETPIQTEDTIDEIPRLTNVFELTYDSTGNQTEPIALLDEL